MAAYKGKHGRKKTLFKKEAVLPAKKRDELSDTAVIGERKPLEVLKASAARVDDTADVSLQGQEPSMAVQPPLPVQPGSHQDPGARQAPAQEQTSLIPPAGPAGGGMGDDDEAGDALALQNLEQRRKKQRVQKRRKIIVAACVAAAVVAAIVVPRVLAANQQEVETPATAQVYYGDLTSSVSVSGTAQPVSSVYVTPEVDGIIQDVKVKEGDSVKAGDVLFTLKNDQLDRAVSDAQQQVSTAQAQLDSAKRQQANAESAYQKAKDAQATAAAAAASAAQEADDADGADAGSAGTGSATTTTEAQASDTSDLDALYEAIQSAKDNVTSAQSTLDSAKQSLTDAQAEADKRTVKAPADGSIIAISAQDGQAYGSASGGSSSGTAQTGAQGSLVQIADLSKLRVSTQVNEIDISGVQEGQAATVTFSAISDLSLPAYVEHIATVSNGDGSSDGSGVVTYQVDLIIDNPDPRIKPGMSATAEIQTQNVTGVLIVPIAALQDYDEEQGTAKVTVVTLDDEGQIQMSEDRSVTVQDKNGSDAAVIGVSEGDIVEIPDGSGDASASDASGSDDAATDAASGSSAG